jgi:hypothetical protein
MFDRFEVVEINESVKIYFSQKVSPSFGVLKIKFDGTLNENSTGFYKTRCSLRDGSTGFAAVTQFEVFIFN